MPTADFVTSLADGRKFPRKQVMDRDMLKSALEASDRNWRLAYCVAWEYPCAIPPNGAVRKGRKEDQHAQDKSVVPERGGPRRCRASVRRTGPARRPAGRGGPHR